MSKAPENTTPDPAGENLQDMPLFDFEWLKNENLLRDEGVYFGLTSDEPPDEKLATIDSYFEEYISRLERAIELYDESSRILEEEVSSVQETIQETETALQALFATYVLSPNDFWRVAAGLLGYGLIIIFNFWLIFEIFGPAWQFPVAVTIGVMLFGLLTSFSRQSWLLSFDDAGKKVSWKLILEELGVPLMASAFLIAWSHEQLAVYQMAALFLFSFVFFLFVGKGLLSSIQQIGPHYKIAIENRQQNRYRRKRIKTLEGEIAQLKTLRERLREQRIGQAKVRFDHSVQLEQLRKKKDTVKNYFLSEFKLARDSRKFIQIEDVMNQNA